MICAMGGGHARSNKTRLGPPPENSDNDGAVPRRQRKPPQARAHLVVSAIKVAPLPRKASPHFPFGVFVKNIGGAPSGEYDLRILLKDVSNGYKYQIGTFRRQGLRPGEEAAAYSSTSGPLNGVGSYQVQAEIQPFLFEDSAARDPKIRDFALE